MVTPVMPALSIRLMADEGLCDAIDGECVEEERAVSQKKYISGRPDLHQDQKWKLDSGLFFLLKQEIDLPIQQLREIFRAVLLF